MKNILLLVSGIVITLICVIFSTQLFETLYYEREFSNEMYNQNIYFTIALILCSIAWVTASIYYYLINSVSFSRWFHWLITLFVACFVSAIASDAYATVIFSDLQLNFSNQLFNFSIVLFFVELVLFTIVSFSIRWWSSNCRHTPIPE